MEGQIDDGAFYLDTEEYEDYSSGYWDSDWITEYYDNRGISDKIQYMIRFTVRNIKQLNSGIVFRDGKCIFQWKKQNVRNI